MTDAAATSPVIRPEPVVISRRFSARRELVFQAWSSAEHIKQWFSPQTYSTPDAEIEFRAGGVFAVCMRSPEGHEYWTRGEFTEVTPSDRLAFAGSIAVGGAIRFSTRTTVVFEQDGFGTQMTVTQEYEVFDPAFLSAVAGAPEGWRTTIDKLEREVARIEAAAGSGVTHGAFTLERTYAAAPAKVFHALTDITAKAAWFGGAGPFTVIERTMDVRPGGHERLQGLWPSGMVTTFDATYFDVVVDRRLVYAYEMRLDDRKISVSLATLTLEAVEGGTRLTVTEQGAFLDGYEDGGSREHGTGALLDQLGAAVEG